MSIDNRPGTQSQRLEASPRAPRDWGASDRRGVERLKASPRAPRDWGVSDLRGVERRRGFRFFLAVSVRLALASAAVATLALPGCGGTQSTPKTVSLRMKGDLADAEVTIDDIDVGPLGYVAVRGVALPPGEHRVTVEKSGYFPWDALIKADEQPIYLNVVLLPIPD
jgi:hypothetical protein